jgi:DHA1 family inner membrane transport protein
MAVSTQRGTLPALLSMMVGGFAIGTSEYASVGVLPQIADDFGVNLARAGLVVSGYALGVSFGSPILAALTGKPVAQDLDAGGDGLVRPRQCGGVEREL